MKLKLKIDRKTLQDFLLQNVEKIVLGVVALLFFFMLYSSLTSAVHYNKTPDQLKSAVTTAKRDIESTTFEGYIENLAAASPAEELSDPNNPTSAPVNKTLAVNKYVERAKQSRLEIDETPYVTPVNWNSPLFAKAPLRDAPPLYAVQELRSKAAIGAFRTVGRAGAGERLIAQPWIVVTGLVPIQKQRLAYADTFKQSLGYDPQNDYPVYAGYLVERVEVDDANEAAPDWEKAKKFVSYREVDKAKQKWAAASNSDVVAPKFVQETLTFPLGPLVNRTWDAAVAHEPEIPVLAPDSIKGQGAFGLGGGLMGAGREVAIRGEPAAGVPGGRNPMMPGGMGAFGREGERTEGLRFDGEEQDAETKTADKETVKDETDDGPPTHQLFRFFDFTVEPGKHYVYRIQLVLKNPNYDQRESYLKNSELAKERYLKTKWSDPSVVTAGPRDTQILLTSVKTRKNADPSAEILMTTWVRRKGIEVYKDFTVTRGQIANYSNEKGTSIGGDKAPTGAGPGLFGGERGLFGRGEPDDKEKPKKPDRTPKPPAGGPEGLGALLGPMGGRPGAGPGAPPVAPAETSSSTADFVSNATAVDMRGGERLAGRSSNTVNSPGLMLLLDADGVLNVLEDVEDQPKSEAIKNPPSTEPERPAGAVPPMGRPTGLDRM